jgi:hypothetical protein
VSIVDSILDLRWNYDFSLARARALWYWLMFRENSDREIVMEFTSFSQVLDLSKNCSLHVIQCIRTFWLSIF